MSEEKMAKKIIKREDIVAEDESWKDGIEESFRAQIPDAETPEQKKELADLIASSAEAGHLRQDQVNRLYQELGVTVVETVDNRTPGQSEPPEAADDRRAWESTLRDEYKALRLASQEVKRLKEELKEARKVVAEREATITRLVGEGSTGFKSRRLF